MKKIFSGDAAIAVVVIAGIILNYSAGVHPLIWCAYAVIVAMYLVFQIWHSVDLWKEYKALK